MRRSAVSPVISGPWSIAPASVVRGALAVYSISGEIHNAWSPLAPSSVGRAYISNNETPFRSTSTWTGLSPPLTTPLLKSSLPSPFTTKHTEPLSIFPFFPTKPANCFSSPFRFQRILVPSTKGDTAKLPSSGFVPQSATPTSALNRKASFSRRIFNTLLACAPMTFLYATPLIRAASAVTVLPTSATPYSCFILVRSKSDTLAFCCADTVKTDIKTNAREKRFIFFFDSKYLLTKIRIIRIKKAVNQQIMHYIIKNSFHLYS